MADHQWMNLSDGAGLSLDCGWCGAVGAGVGGVFIRSSHVYDRVLICNVCGGPSVEWRHTRVPGVPYGESVDHVPEETARVYEEARAAFGAGAYTGVALLCRKALMHVANSLGADDNLNFVQYVDYLVEDGHVPKNARGWVDKIRVGGNEPNHEIVFTSEDEAKELLAFTSMLLKVAYEFPARAAGALEE